MVPVQDTIAAISTPPGQGGLAVLRLSGPDALAIAKLVTTFRFQMNDPPPNSARFTRVEQDGEVIDEVVLTYFQGPLSYTGEDVVEISCHGGRYAATKILELLLLKGARQANPGEFTERAFLNNKLDLAQAEAVAGLIHARTEQAGKAAIRQLSGGLSDKVKAMRSKLLDLLALLELELDFSDEDVEFQTRASRRQQLLEVETELKQLLATFQRGRLVREGLKVAIVGAPNAGKSTLLNALLGEERAIVSEEPGTTRDVVEAHLLLDGIEVILQDTAGIRETEGKIEGLGIERTRRTLQAADLVMLVIDEVAPQWPKIDEVSTTNKIILIINKIDLRVATAHPATPMPPEGVAFAATFEISAHTHAGIQKLLDSIVPMILSEHTVQDEIVITEARHNDCLNRAKLSVESAATQLSNPTLMASDLRDAVNALGEITGETIDEAILDRIFSKFCIGK